MAIKYISKSAKNKKWKISTSKTGKAIKTFNTQKEAIAYAATINSTEAIQIKRTSGWVLATSWDKKTIDKALKAEFKAKAKGKNDVAAKKAAVQSVKSNTNEKSITKKVVAEKKATTKKIASKKKVAPKKVASKKPPIKKKVVKKIPETKKLVANKNKKTNKPVIVEKIFVKNNLKNLKGKQARKPLSGFLGFILGLSIIVVFVSIAFILGYFL